MYRDGGTPSAIGAPVREAHTPVLFTGSSEVTSWFYFLGVRTRGKATYAGEADEFAAT